MYLDLEENPAPEIDFEDEHCKENGEKGKKCGENGDDFTRVIVEFKLENVSFVIEVI